MSTKKQRANRSPDASLLFETADDTKYLNQLVYSIEAPREHVHDISGDTMKV